MFTCDYCSMTLIDSADVRRHILSLAHLQNKNAYELSMDKYFKREYEAKLHPNNFEQLCMSLNMHSDKDVTALEKEGFFKMERLRHYDVAEELLKVLMDSGIKYHLERLPTQVQEQLLKSLEEERLAKEPAKGLKSNK